MAYLKVVLGRKVGKDIDTLIYEAKNSEEILPGQIIKVPLRKKTLPGFVLEVSDHKPDFPTKEITEIAEKNPLLSTKQIQLLKWISDYYFCPISKTLKLFIPKNIFEQKKTRKASSKKTPEKAPPKITEKSPIKKLSDEQEKAFEEIINKFEEKKENQALIIGVTGSGKTEVYTRLANFYLQKNHQVLILIPEISLTPQTIEYFEKNLGIEASVINSKLTDKERAETWRKIHTNESKLIIGSRSSIFAPFQDLKLIIVDEEHENSYKQDTAPRYKIHSIIEKIQEFNNDLKVVYGSATPSVETSEKLKNSKVILNTRIGNTPLPDIEIVDLREEFKKKNYSIFSEKLHEELETILKNKEQAILFLNRRGSASSVICRDCGYVQKCEACDLPMTYHTRTLQKPVLICHHCGKISSPENVCPVCHGAHIRFLGIGTQRVEEELSKEFPEARILRADKDTTAQKDSFEKIYRDFREHKADILVGTQMISKGLHLPKVNLVGVILADIGLTIPEFRTVEHNFQLLLQVAGRSGRGGKKGKVIIQTYEPENPALIFAQKQNYEDFFNLEIIERRVLNNPPFGYLSKILIRDKSNEKCQTITKKIEDLLFKIARELDIAKDLEIFSYPAYILRLRGYYQYIISLKSITKKEFIHQILEKLPKEYIIDPNIKIDVDPITLT